MGSQVLHSHLSGFSAMLVYPMQHNLTVSLLSGKNVVKFSLWVSSTSPQFFHHISSLPRKSSGCTLGQEADFNFPSLFIFYHSVCFSLPTFMTTRTKVCSYNIESSAFFFLSNPSLIIFWMLFTTKFCLWKTF